MRIAMIGHKRFGSREGGVEVVVTELARRMAALGHEVTCYDRSGLDVMTGEATETRERIVDGVRVVPVKTVDKKGLAALSSSYFAAKQAVKDKPDVIHFHAEGPCAALSIAKKAGIRTVATIHGLDWKRGKWGKVASTYIKFGEKTAAKKADELIVLSKSDQAYFQETYGRASTLIPNGVDEKENIPAKLITDKWGLTQGSYILYLGRLVPEKRADLLVSVFKNVSTDKKLVIAGGGSDTSEYEKSLREVAKGDSRIIFTGFVQGQVLEELYSNAYAYVLPSDVEGMPLSLLEAMAHGCCCITSDIPECADVLGGCGVTFPKGNAEALQQAIEKVLEDHNLLEKQGKAAREYALKAYNWNITVKRTLDVYEKYKKEI